MRILIKGGVWKNTEDEILKAAVMKYGKNQWARISSLLVRKSPKQCKARWYEWLDPSIKKTEWSKEEDEKLLHLAKLMPTQWRTIAPIVGRTPSQCLERYQKLLDEVEKQTLEDGESSGAISQTTAEDVRKLRTGEIDPDPEAKPARPDPVDMEEDEKEMLSEARARLANTQGKKAKRKARERLLEEAKRLASLQKQRELKAAGLIFHKKRKSKGMNYNTETPFEQPAPIGFFDTTDEKILSEEMKQNVADKMIEARARNKGMDHDDRASKNAKKRKTDKDGFALPPPVRRNEEETSTERSRLNLPAPQVTDAELDEIVKIGNSGEQTKSMMPDAEATNNLLGTYTEFNTPMHQRTPRTAVLRDHLKEEALNLRLMTQQQTPLLGGENTPLMRDSGTGFDGMTPRRSVVSTPLMGSKNELASIHGTPSSSNTFTGSKMDETPTKGLWTPKQRDNLMINTPQLQQSSLDMTPKDETLRQIGYKKSVVHGLQTLPKPQNDFEIIIPQIEEDEEDLKQQSQKEEDSAEKRIQREMEELKAAKLLVHQELEINDQLFNVDSLAPFDVWREDFEKSKNDIISIPGTENRKHRSECNAEDLVAYMHHLFHSSHSAINQCDLKASQIENDLVDVHGKYQKASQHIFNSICQEFDELENLRIQKQSFLSLATIEKRGAEHRIQLLRQDVHRQLVRQRELQTEYLQISHQV